MDILFIGIIICGLAVAGLHWLDKLAQKIGFPPHWAFWGGAACVAALFVCAL